MKTKTINARLVWKQSAEGRAKARPYSKTTKNKRINPGVVWKQVEDVVVPKLRLPVIDRAAYCYLLRHSRLEVKRRVQFSITWLARGIRVSLTPARQALRRLIEHGALRLVERSKAGHLVEVRLPEEIPALRGDGNAAGNNGAGGAGAGNGAGFARAGNLEEMDFLQTKELREAIHARERGRCFYCLRRTNARTRCLDHVVPQVEFGSNSYRNLVSCCVECNSQKGERSGGDFLRWLYREGELTKRELKTQLKALEALGAGKLRPEIGSKEVRM